MLNSFGIEPPRLTLRAAGMYNSRMAKSDMKKPVNENTKRFVCALPLAGLALLVLLSFALFGISFSYAVAIMTAWGSEMVFFLLFGVSFIGVAACIGSCLGFLGYLNKVYYDRYPTAAYTAMKQHAAEREASASHVEKKKIATPQNAAYTLLVVAVIFIVVSAGLGCLQQENWLAAKTPYMISKGYLPDCEERTLTTLINTDDPGNPHLTITAYVDDRPVVVRYEATNKTEVEIKLYYLYENNYTVAMSTESSETRIRLNNDAPAITEPLDKMLGFLFTPTKAEKQIIITVPLAYKDNVKIVADNVIYAKD